MVGRHHVVFAAFFMRPKERTLALGVVIGNPHADTPQTGITLSSNGRTVSGVAYQNNGGGVIAVGRGGTVTLDDGTQKSFTVGQDGAFSVTFPMANDGNANKTASIYTQNAAAGSFAQLNFTYST